MAPAINTNTCCHVGLVKPCRNGSIQAASLGRPTPAIRPPNPIGKRLDRIESAANPWCDHKGFNSDAASENGQSRAYSWRTGMGCIDSGCAARADRVYDPSLQALSRLPSRFTNTSASSFHGVKCCTLNTYDTPPSRATAPTAAHAFATFGMPSGGLADRAN